MDGDINISVPSAFTSMRGTGFEPVNALSNESLNLARLTTPASPHKLGKNECYKKLSCVVTSWVRSF